METLWNFHFIFKEIVVLLLFYSVLRIKGQRKNPEQYRKVQPLGNIFIGIIPLVIFQYLIIGWMTVFLNPEQNFIKQNLLLTKEVYFALGSAVVLYTIKAVQIANYKERLVIFQSNFLFKVLALTGTNIIGLVLIVGIGIKSLFPVLSLMVILRVFLEIYFGRRIKSK